MLPNDPLLKLTYHEVLVDLQHPPLFRVKETVLNSAHLKESLLLLVLLCDFLHHTLVQNLSRHFLHLQQQDQAGSLLLVEVRRDTVF